MAPRTWIAQHIHHTHEQTASLHSIYVNGLGQRHTHSIDFLDLTISLSPKYSLEWKLLINCLTVVFTCPFCRLCLCAQSAPLPRTNTLEADRIHQTEGDYRKERNWYHNYWEPTTTHKAKYRERPRPHPSQWWKGSAMEKPDQIILKLLFINDALSSRITQRVRPFSPDVRVVFKLSPSLKEKLARSSLCARVYPQDVQAARKEPGPGRPMMCGACDAGMRNSECSSKNVVYCMCGE